MAKKITELPVATSVADDDPILVTDLSTGLSVQADAALLRGASTARTEIFLDMIADEAFLLDDTNSTGTFIIGPLIASDPNADEGYGILALDTGAGAGKALLEHGAGGLRFTSFRGSLAVVAELRVKLPATPSDISFSWGFDNLVNPTSCKCAYDEGAGTWLFLIESDAGGSSDFDDTAIAVVGGWNTLRLEYDPGSEARFYVNDVLVSTLSDMFSVPQTADEMFLYFDCETAGATPGAIYIDWVRILVDRA